MNLIEVLIKKAELLSLNYNNQSIFKSDKVNYKVITGEKHNKTIVTCFTYETMNALKGSPITSMSYPRLLLTY